MDSRGSMITGSSVVRVLLIDNDVESSRSVKKMLKECDYKVTTSDSLQQGLELLNDRKDGFDIVMCDIDARMGDLDSFSFVRQMDLPVVMMSGDKDDSKVIKSFQHGACAYLRKPIIIEEVHRIWHLVIQKQMAKGRLNEIQNHGAEESGLSNRPSSSSERKDVDNGNPSTSSKKTRVVWSPHLHHKFVEAVNKIGLQKACPKKILNLMGSERLTRENVASHLQKYRLSLQRKKLDPIPTPVQQQQDHSHIASRRHPVARCNQTWGHPVYLGHQTLPDQSAMIMERNVVAYGATLPTLVQTDNVTNSCGTTLDHNASLYPDAVPFLPKQELNPNYAMDQCSQLDYYSSCVNPICSTHWIPSSASANGGNVLSVPWGTLVPSSYSLSSHINDVAPCHQTNSILVVGAACNDRPTLTHHLETNLHLSGSGPGSNADLGSDNCIHEQYGDQFLDLEHLQNA